MGKDLKGKELGKGIRQNQNGRYEARYMDRFGNRKSIYANSKVEIKQKLNEAIKADLQGKTVEKRMTVRSWYELWMKEYKAPVIRPNTRRHYESIFDRIILPELSELYLEEVKQIHIKKIINRLSKNGYGWETKNKVKLLTQDLFNVAIDNHYAIENPTKGIRLVKSKSQERIILTVDQQKDFFRCCAGTFYDNLFTTLINSGLRSGEACALTEQDLDFDKKLIHVDTDRGTLLYQKLPGEEKKMFHLGPPKTYTSVRDVPMNQRCEEALRSQIILKKILSRRHPQEGDFKDLLFTTRRNTPICSSVLNDAIKKIIEEINLQRDVIDAIPSFSSHTFRHTFATRCIEAGISPKVLQNYLGHATLQMTMDLYVHVTNDFSQNEIQKLDTVFPKIDNYFIDLIDGVKVG